MPRDQLTKAEFYEACRKFTDWCVEQFFDGYDIDGGDAQDLLVELGLIRSEPGGYDPKKHLGLVDDSTAFEEGDPLYFRHPWFTDGILPYEGASRRMFVSSFRAGGWAMRGDERAPDELEVTVQDKGGKVVERANYRRVADA